MLNRLKKLVKREKSREEELLRKVEELEAKLAKEEEEEKPKRRRKKKENDLLEEYDSPWDFFDERCRELHGISGRDAINLIAKWYIRESGLLEDELERMKVVADTMKSLNESLKGLGESVDVETLKEFEDILKTVKSIEELTEEISKSRRKVDLWKLLDMARRYGLLPF